MLFLNEEKCPSCGSVLVSERQEKRCLFCGYKEKTEEIPPAADAETIRREKETERAKEEERRRVAAEAIRYRNREIFSMKIQSFLGYLLIIMGFFAVVGSYDKCVANYFDPKTGYDSFMGFLVLSAIFLIGAFYFIAYMINCNTYINKDREDK